jgi:hypothetical protein
MAPLFGVMMVGFGEEGNTEIYPTELPEAVQQAVDATFKERGALTSDIVDASGNFAIEFETTISMTFVGKGAGYKNQVGYFTYDANGAILEQHIVFENFSGTGPGLAGGGDLNPGDTVNIGTFAPGENVGFFLLANGFKRENAPMWSTLEDLNSDGKDHDAVLSIEEIGTLIGFEDLRNLGDRDYNDALLLITAVVEALEEDPELSLDDVIDVIGDIDESLAGDLEEALEARNEPVPSPFELTAQNVSAMIGVSVREAYQIVREYGLVAVSRAVQYATDRDSFWSSLLGYDVLGSSVAGGGGSVGGLSSYVIDFQLRHPISGELLVSENVSLTIVEKPNNIIDIVVAPFDPETGSYVFDLRTISLAPGQYDLYLGFTNGTYHLMSLFVPAIG